MKNNAVVLGIAPCLEKDLKDLFSIIKEGEFDFLAVGVDCSDRVLFDIQHAVSYHPNEFLKFKERRKAVGGNLNYQTHSHTSSKTKISPFIPSRIWPLIDKHPLSGSSSFLAAQVALGLDYGRIILCGCPMSGANLNKSTYDYDVYQKGWEKHSHIFGGKVRSMSGWTKEYLGYPDLSWLANSGEIL